jgi:ABC-type uncharacterized transport system permease subunit
VLIALLVSRDDRSSRPCAADLDYDLDHRYPGGASLGSLVFGFFDSLQEKLALLKVGIANQLLGMAPYLATMIVLAGIVGRSRMPAADGTPYEKE